MFWKCHLFVLILLPAIIFCQDYNVRITLKDGSIIEGKLLKISVEGVDINPGGNVKYRFISGERIKNVNIVELKKTIDYPLLSQDIPKEIMEYNSGEGSVEARGFPKFLGVATFGYASVGDWKYYEGFNSGNTLRLGLYYFFHESDISASRFLVGFSYNRSSISGDRIYDIEPKLSLSEYSFEFGRTTGLLGNGHYLYLLMGFVIVTNDVELNLGSSGGISSSVNVNETKGALRIEGGGSISIGPKISILLSLGYDILLGEKEKSIYYNYNEPNFSVIGGILNMSIGLTYGF